MPSKCMSSLMSLVIEISGKYLSSIYLASLAQFSENANATMRSTKERHIEWQRLCGTAKSALRCLLGVTRDVFGPFTRCLLIL